MTKQQSDLFKQGTLELLILRLLSSGSLNGWDIMQRIELLSGADRHPRRALSRTPSSRSSRSYLLRLATVRQQSQSEVLWPNHARTKTTRGATPAMGAIL